METNNQLNGTISVPGDKSISHRSIILGAISHGTTTINNFLRSADCLSTMAVFQNLGVKIDEQNQQIKVHGVGINGLKDPSVKLNMGNSGTSTRLISGLLAGQSFSSEVVGDASLSKRPMKRIITPLSEMGAKIHATDNHLPMTIDGSRLHGIEYTMPVASAQVKSAIILAALNADGNTTIIEPVKSRDHTENMLMRFSPNSIEKHANQIIIHPRHSLTGQAITVPGDMSSAAFFLVAAAVIPNSKVTIQNVGINPTRAGIINVLKRAGAKIRIENQTGDAEPSADITVEAGALTPFTVGSDEIPGLVDEVPLLALLAARANGTSKITGAEELRFKESDRLNVIATEFKKLGIAIEELRDGFIIDGSKPWHLVDPNLDSHKDHRIAMTLKIASLLLKQPVTIKDFDCINISYPTFSDDLAKLRS
ncbi:3-phosphoshikimate 1-carboxyvinyltransferase (plasmid) [Nicoliella spurrieriana]|uniref:3-phosphoshikimate 1-carboxyvinyltransferase n=1 Tax=Nicoliella spurrieriana TaxID=2925830 RepID=A0A976RQQ5_9LACO|nr:3-phosphoshikimate 1-carboxyvinyltransferase [Nicoliella spurrieriana]UQS86017.1 3-phosphoshikimate 1-carboxyvinyltransferase [Nicoliella spurrieriana]